ncbi:glycoside hydrolase superfamily [Powellomyces hirtus]|nr:glycoside hydrolase superfamily [Powellomyces hirtus]
MLSEWLRVSLLRFLLFSQSARSASSYVLIGYWGRNLAQNQWRDESRHEPSLGSICATTLYTHIHISSMKVHFDATGLPGLDLDLHCRWPTDKFPEYPDPPRGFNVLNCPKELAQDIRDCQKMGIKIILSIAPMDMLTTEQQAMKSAENIWNVFLGGSSKYRPFGISAILDGVDFQVRNNDPRGDLYVPLIRRLRELMDADTGRKYTIAGSTLCIYPDFLLGPYQTGAQASRAPLDMVPEMFDILIPFFTSSPARCGWGGNQIGFWDTLKQWVQFTSTFMNNSTQLVVGLPSWFVPEWANAAAGDYIAPSDLWTSIAMETFRTEEIGKVFGGFALQDVSLDVLNWPCNNDPRVVYSTLLTQQLTLPVSETGRGKADPTKLCADAVTIKKHTLIPGLVTNSDEPVTAAAGQVGAVDATGSASSTAAATTTRTRRPASTMVFEDVYNTAQANKITFLGLVFPIILIAVVALLVNG